MAKQANRLALAVMVVMVVAGGRANADSTAPPPTAAEEAEAKRLFIEGTKSFSLAEYADAIRFYRAAYKIVPQPLFLYDIGQAYRLAKEYEKAKGFYESFLLNLPDASIRAEVETLIAQMDAAIASQPKASVRVPSPVEAARLSPTSAAPAPVPRLREPPAHTGRRPIYKKWWFWAGVGAVAVGATVAVVAGSGGGNGAPSSGLGTSKVFN